MNTMRWILGVLAATFTVFVLLSPAHADRTGSQAKQLPTPGRVPPTPGDPANSYRWGPGHSTGKTGTNSPFGRNADPAPPKRCYYIIGLGTKSVSAWYEENGQKVNVSADMQRRSDGKDEKGNNRPFQVQEQAFDLITGLLWNWVGSSRSGGVQINAGAVGDVNVPAVNDFDDIAKAHDIQSWIDANFAFGELVAVRVNGRWIGYTKNVFTHVAVVVLFANATLNTLHRARDTALRYGALDFAAKALELELKFDIGIGRAKLAFLKDVLPTLFKEPEYRHYMTGEFARSMNDFARRLKANPKLSKAVAEVLGVAEKDIMPTFIDPSTDRFKRGKAFEMYVINRERGFDLNRLKKDIFPLVDMLSADGRYFVSIAFGRPHYYEDKFDALLNVDKLQAAEEELNARAANLPSRVVVPARKRELLQRIQLCVGTAADAEELRGYIRRTIQLHGLKAWGEDAYNLMKQAWRSDSAIQRNLLAMVRGPA